MTRPPFLGLTVVCAAGLHLVSLAAMARQLGRDPSTTTDLDAAVDWYVLAFLTPPFSESFHVLEGRLSVFDGDRWGTLGTGDTPGAPREDYFRGMVELRAGGRVPSTEELDELAARYDQLNLRD